MLSFTPTSFGLASKPTCSVPTTGRITNTRKHAKVSKLRMNASNNNEEQSSQGQPPPPPPPPPIDVNTKGQQFEDALDKFVDSTRDIYLPASFVIGASTYGLKTALDNFVFQSDPVGFIGCTLMSGAIISATAWVLFDFIDTPKR